MRLARPQPRTRRAKTGKTRLNLLCGVNLQVPNHSSRGPGTLTLPLAVLPALRTAASCPCARGIEYEVARKINGVFPSARGFKEIEGRASPASSDRKSLELPTAKPLFSFYRDHPTRFSVLHVRSNSLGLCQIMENSWVMKYARADGAGSVLLHASAHGDACLDLDLLATEGEAPYRGKSEERSSETLESGS